MQILPSFGFYYFYEAPTPIHNIETIQIDYGAENFSSVGTVVK